jgi:Outer membrane protein
MKIKLFIVSACFCVSNANALTLLEAYDSSVKEDPQLQAAKFEMESAKKDSDIGFSYLLPSINANGKILKTSGRTDLDQNSITGLNSYSSNTDYQSKSVSINIKQPLYDMERYSLYKEGVVNSNIGIKRFLTDKQRSAQELVSSYLELLRVKNEFLLAEKQLELFDKLKSQSMKMYQNGEGTVIDIDEMNSRYDLALSKKIEAEAEIRNTENILFYKTGKQSNELLMISENIDSKPMVLINEDLIFWQNKANSVNPLLIEKEEEIEYLRYKIKEKSSAHQPKINLVGQMVKSKINQLNKEQDRVDKTIGLTIDIPIYAGGGISANTDKQRLILTQNLFLLDDTRKQVALDIESKYIGVTTGWQRCVALLSAVKSAEHSLFSTQKGFNVGEKPLTELLDAQDRVFTAKKDFINAKLKMLNSFSGLMSLVNELDSSQILKIQSKL